MATRKQIGWTVPGFGLPLRWPEMQSVRWQPFFQPDENTLLLSALDGSENPRFCYTVRERKMLALINELTDVPDWNRQIFDPEFTLKWRNEKNLSGEDVTRSMAEWCIEEAKYYVQKFVLSQIIPAIDGGVVKSDTLVPLYLHQDLKRAIAGLRKSSGFRSKDNASADVVDPYLYAFGYERTKTLRSGKVSLTDCISRSGEGELAKQPSEDDCVQKDPAKYPNKKAWSRRFQFLPFDVEFDSRNGTGSRISSYINDVHPDNHRHFYRTLENLIDGLIPMFNETLIDLKAPGYQNQRFHLAVLGRDPMVEKEPREFRPPEERASTNWLDPQGRYHDWIFVDLKKEFWNIGLQMVLRVTEICLTPEQPHYEGEDWHVEGQMNERVCATAKYVYSSHNITPARLSFRRRICYDEAMIAKDYIQTPPFASDLYGAQDGDPILQDMGSVDLSSREGRAVTYPNVFQTRLEPFSLADPNHPKGSGTLKILTLHLIDPNRRSMSTSMVPCQRRDWWAEAVRHSCPVLWRLPREIYDRIITLVDGESSYPIGDEEGRKIRDAFKAERKEALRLHNKAMEEYLYWDLEVEE